MVKPNPSMQKRPPNPSHSGRREVERGPRKDGRRTSRSNWAEQAKHGRPTGTKGCARRSLSLLPLCDASRGRVREPPSRLNGLRLRLAKSGRQRHAARAANLNAREQRLQRDKAIAEAVRDLARSQAQVPKRLHAAARTCLPRARRTGCGKRPARARNRARRANQLPAGLRQRVNRRALPGRRARCRRPSAISLEACAAAPARPLKKSPVGQAAVEIVRSAQAMARAAKLSPRKPAQARRSGGVGRFPWGPPSTIPADGPAADPSKMPSDDSADLGTGFIPNSPEATAEMMAGEGSHGPGGGGAGERIHGESRRPRQLAGRFGRSGRLRGTNDQAEAATDQQGQQRRQAAAGHAPARGVLPAAAPKTARLPTTPI